MHERFIQQQTSMLNTCTVWSTAAATTSAVAAAATAAVAERTRPKS